MASKSVKSAWKRICKWLKNNGPSELDSLIAPSADGYGLERLESTLGARIPTDFIFVRQNWSLEA